MNRLPIEERLLRNVRILSQSSPQEMRMVPRGDGAFPSVAALRDIVSLVRAIVFPDFFDCKRNNERIRSCYLGVNIEKLYSLLHTEIRRALRFDNTYEEEDVSEEASLLALQFIDEPSGDQAAPFHGCGGNV